MKIRWTRYPVRADMPPPSARRLNNAKKAVEREKEKYGLFPELATFQTGEERLAHIDAETQRHFQKLRKSEAENWIEARKILREMNFAQRLATLLYWNKYTSCPASAVYLLELVKNVRDGKIDLDEKIAELRKLRARSENNTK